MTFSLILATIIAMNQVGLNPILRKKYEKYKDRVHNFPLSTISMISKHELFLFLSDYQTTCKSNYLLHIFGK